MSDDAQPYTREEIAEFERELEHELERAAVERGAERPSAKREGWATLNRIEDAETAMLWCAENPVPQRVIDDAMVDLSALGFNPREPGIAEIVLRKIIGLALYGQHLAAVERGVRETPTEPWTGAWNNWIAPFHACPRCGASLNWKQGEDVFDQAMVSASCCGIHYGAHMKWQIESDTARSGRAPESCEHGTPFSAHCVKCSGDPR